MVVIGRAAACRVGGLVIASALQTSAGRMVFARPRLEGEESRHA